MSRWWAGTRRTPPGGSSAACPRSPRHSSGVRPGEGVDYQGAEAEIVSIEP